MYRAVCAVVIAIAGSFAARAQAAGDPPQGGSIVSTVSADVVKDLAPTGKLRAAINLGNMVLAQGTPAASRAASPSTWRANWAGGSACRSSSIAVRCRRQGVRGAQDRRGWDIVFLAIEPVRAAEIDFTAPYVIIEGVYMVPKDRR